MRSAGRPQDRSAALDLVDHGAWAAYERLVDGADRQQGVGECLYLGAVQAAIEQLHFLLFAAEQVVKREAGEVAVLEVFQLLVEHDAGLAAVAVEQA